MYRYSVFGIQYSVSSIQYTDAVCLQHYTIYKLVQKIAHVCLKTTVCTIYKYTQYKVCYTVNEMMKLDETFICTLYMYFTHVAFPHFSLIILINASQLSYTPTTATTTTIQTYENPQAFNITYIVWWNINIIRRKLKFSN